MPMKSMPNQMRSSGNDGRIRDSGENLPEAGLESCIPVKTRDAAIIAVGDVHGELEALREILRHAGLLGNQDQWIGGNTILVQTGDVIDRGPKSKEAYALLASLQSEAPRTGGKVIRLLGNHELALLQGEFCYADFQGADDFRRILARDVLAGGVQAAFAGQGYLFTHAGLRTEIRERLLANEARKAGVGEPEVLADRINRILMDAVTSGNYLDPIFHVGHSRGGPHPVGGIFWEDASEIKSSAQSGGILQVFGHTVQKQIQISRCASLVAIDIGMHHYGGRAYLKLREGKPFARDAASRYRETSKRTTPAKALRELAAVRPVGLTWGPLDTRLSLFQ
ncbi:MAG: metallophosphoesterase [Betaproteobacteria bacterium]|nr:metallophosphoesterase [Betaproteobacteria bacterium]